MKDLKASPGREWWPLVVGMALLGFYAFVLSLPLEVSERYRQYYVERSISAWHGGRDPIYTLGHELDFRQRQTVLSQFGWGGPEADGTWTLGHRAALVLHVSPTARPRFLQLTLRPFVNAPRGPAVQVLALRLNGQPLGSWQLSGPQALTVALPAALAENPNGTLRLDFELPRASAPYDWGIARDRRLLAVCLQRLRLW